MTNYVQSIPLLPAAALKDTIKFYEDLGFVNVYDSKTRAQSYAVMENNQIAFHLYAYKKLSIPTPTNIYLFVLENLDEVYDMFIDHYKSVYNRVPNRTGLPRVGIPRNLNEDRRFTITDPNGNYLIFTQSYDKEIDHQIKTRFEKIFWEANTLAYSKESPTEAKKMMIAGFKRLKDDTQEKAELIFQGYVLLADNCKLLDEPDLSAQYLELASKYYEKVKSIKNIYLDDSKERYLKLIKNK